MKKTNTIIITSIVVAFVFASGVVAINYNSSDTLDVQYIPSDLNNVYSNYEVTERITAASWATLDIKKVKDQLDYTIKGTVVSISDPMSWLVSQESEEMKLIRGETIRIEVDIKVEKAKTHNSDKPDLVPGSIYTITITGNLFDNVIRIDSDEDQYEIGEKVIVHVAHSDHQIVGEDVNYVVLAKHSKYKIQGDKAYNDKNKNGKSLNSAFDEAN